MSTHSARRPAPVSAADLPIRRNTVILAAAMAAITGMFQLVAAISSLTFVEVTGVEGLLGLGPAIFLTAAALTSFQAGRAMDRLGRVPVIAAGFVAGTVGTVVTGFGAQLVSTTLVVIGFLLMGASLGTVSLVRTAGGDMATPDRRAQGISRILFGAVFGAFLGPVVFSPLFAGRELDAEQLAVPWFAGAGFTIAGLVLVLAVRPDPKRIAEIIAPTAVGEVEAVEARLGRVLRRPGVVPALVAALAAFGVMVSVMNLAGYVVVHEHGHEQADVFPIIGAHVLGMYALVLVVGAFVDRIGRDPALVGGLLVMSASCLGMLAVESVWATAVLLFGVGLGWNLSFVAASAEMADRTSPSERGKLLGFSDQANGLLAAGLALLGGFALNQFGVAALATGATALVVLPALWIAQRSWLGRPEATAAK
jgi:MFS family permease